MPDIDRYITDDVLHASRYPDYPGNWRLDETRDEDIAHVLRAALPGILAQHRADVLREAAELTLNPDQASWLRFLADAQDPTQQKASSGHRATTSYAMPTTTRRRTPAEEAADD